MKKISIIIPVYNVENYIEKCINSALNQDLNSNEYEILIVDDESPDNSITIIKKLMIDNPQISLYTQKNKGLGGARNTGIINAKGSYLLFLDADDFLNSNVLKNIYNISNNKRLDILEFGAEGVTKKGKTVYKINKSTGLYNNGYEYLYKNKYMNSACNKLYSVDFLRRNNLLFKEQIFIEDFEFNTRAFYFAKKVQGIDSIVSNFVQTSNSITRNKNTIKNSKMIYDILNVIDITTNFYLKSNKRKDTQNIIFERVSFLTTTLLYNIFKLNIDKSTRLKVLNELKEKELYPIKYKVDNLSKNIFRIVANNEFIFNLICNLKFSMKNN